MREMEKWVVVFRCRLRSLSLLSFWAISIFHVPSSAPRAPRPTLSSCPHRVRVLASACRGPFPHVPTRTPSHYVRGDLLIPCPAPDQILTAANEQEQHAAKHPRADAVLALLGWPRRLLSRDGARGEVCVLAADVGLCRLWALVGGRGVRSG